MDLLDIIYKYETENLHGTPTPWLLAWISDIPIEEVKRELEILEKQRKIVYLNKEHDGSYVESTEHYIDRLGITHYRLYILDENPIIKRKYK